MMTDDILSSCSLAARGLNQRMLNAAKQLAGVKKRVEHPPHMAPRFPHRQPPRSSANSRSAFEQAWGEAMSD
ncbi:hypothetical protein [Klebsiella quasipneumoniae]|uniref:hypothetical protein n=1 Tax=Klebsiella quasipneumoniae TaxID=1463165 RepID=UPI003CE87B2B